MLGGVQRVPRLMTRGKEEGRTATRVTVSVPRDIAEYLRSRAEELNEPVSGIVVESILMRQAAELEQAMIEGLLEDAKRDQETVEDWAGTLPEVPD